MAFIGNRPFTVMLTSLLGAQDRPPDDELVRFLRSLLTADWESPESAFRLNPDLTLDQVANSEFLDQARIFLRTLAEDRGAPLTATGNLNRASISRLVERMAWPRRVVEYARRVYQSKKFDEPDVRPLHHIRVICDCGNLVARRSGRLLATKKAIALCDDTQVGKLYRHLFIACFRYFDLSYLGGMPPMPGIQHTIAVILWRLSLKANDWITAGELTSEVFLPMVRAEIRHLDRWPHAEAAVLVIRVLEPLAWFGLLESDTPEDDLSRLFDDRKFRKTPLFDQFIGFIVKV